MKKVIAIDDKKNRILTTAKNAKKKNLWVTHHLEVNILPVTDATPKINAEPDAGNIMESHKRFYLITKSDKILICYTCDDIAKFKIGNLFYCKKHYKHLMTTRPIRLVNKPQDRNAPSACGSGLKFKNCCITKLDHNARHYFNSRFMEDPDIVKNLENQILL